MFKGDWMKSRYIVKRVREAVISWLIAIYIGLLAVGYLGILTVIPYFQAMLRGAVEMTPRQLTNFQGQTLHFVQVEGLEMYDTGFEYTSSNYGIQTEHAYYGALAVGTKLLIIETGAPIDIEQLSYIGSLEPASQAVSQRVIGAIVAEQPELDGVFLPLVLDARAPSNIWWYLGGLFWLFLLGVCMWLLMNMTNILFQPAEHKIMKELLPYGDLQIVITELEDELPKSEKAEKIKFSNTWLILDSFGDFQALRLDELLWFYKHVTQHYYNGIPTGKSIRIYMYDKRGRKIEIKDSMKKVDKMLLAIYQHAPWAIAGYSPEILQMWERQRQSLIDGVEHRKTVLQSQEKQA
jgi:hypothetical protein